MNTEIQTQSETVSESEALVLREDNEGLVTLTLNRPRQFNALSKEVLAALQEELDRIAEDQQARLVVIAGNGKAFCAGHDLKQMRAKREEDYYRTLFKQCSKMMLTLNQMPQPVIAKVQGIATAAGCQLVAACDLAVAADDSRFATSGINVGLFCSTPSVPVSRNLGRKQAMELLLTGHFIDAHTALQWGLVNRVVPASRLDQEVAELAGSIMSKSWVAVATGKRMFYKQLELPLESAYDYASGVMAGNMMADDVEEGVDAFMQKRTPVWKNQ